jgi:AcrR family transcriptional regulator
MRTRDPDPAASSSSSSPAPRRTTRGERIESTRRRLFDAALAAVAEAGHGGATTAEIARRAGISQGMIFKIASTKSQLLADSVHDLFARLVDDWEAAFSAIDQRRDRVRAAIELLDASYRRPELTAAFELYLATRTDAVLARGLREVAERHRADVRALAQRLFPEAALTEGCIAAAVDLAMDTLQGEALSSLANPDPARTRRVVDLLVSLLRPILEANGDLGVAVTSDAA